MRWTRRFAALAALALSATLVSAPAAPAVPAQLTECSAELYHGDRRLGPERLPVLGAVGRQLVGYSRTGYRSEEEFLSAYYDTAANSWRYPPRDGYVLTPGGEPAKWVHTLRAG